jgi:hypothetical protein
VSFGSAFSKAWSSASNAVKSVAADVATGAKWVGQKTQQVAQAVAQGAKAVAQGAKTAAQQVAAAVKAAPAKAQQAKAVVQSAANKAVQKVAAAATAVRQAAVPIAKSVAQTAQKAFTAAKQTFTKAAVGVATAVCPLIGKAKQQAIQAAKTHGPKVIAARAAVGTLVAAYMKDKSGGVLVKAAELADKLAESTGIKIPGRDAINKLPEWARNIGKEVITQSLDPTKIREWKTIGQMIVSSYKTGYLNFGPGNIFGVTGRHYTASGLATAFGNSTLTSMKTALGSWSGFTKAVGNDAGLGAAMDVGMKVFEYATDPKKSFLSGEFASDITKAAASGAIKGVTSSIIVSKATAVGAIAGSFIPIPGVGTMVGAGVGFIAGVLVSKLAEKGIDAAVGKTWEVAGKLAPKAGRAAVAAASGAAGAARSVTQTATRWAATYFKPAAPAAPQQNNRGILP